MKKGLGAAESTSEETGIHTSDAYQQSGIHSSVASAVMHGQDDCTRQQYQQWCLDRATCLI